MQQDSQKIRDLVLARNYCAVGIAPYAVLDNERGHLAEWIAGGNHAAKHYMTVHDRFDPHTVFAECKSLIVILFTPQVEHYHWPIRRELKRLLADIQLIAPHVRGRGVVDTAPILEKAWAVRAGLGSVGRNTLLINPTLGTNFNIGVLLLDVELPCDEPFDHDLCAQAGCEVCLAKCPSGALYDNRTLDCRRCISYVSQQTGTGYGCTICQEACPYNF